MSSWAICSELLRVAVLPDTSCDTRVYFHIPNPDGVGYVRIPRRLANMGQVPEQYREPLKKFLEVYFEGDPSEEGLGSGFLNRHPSPWEHVDAILWGQEMAEGMNRHNLERTTFWDERASNAGFKAVWDDIKTMIQAGCLDHEAMLNKLLTQRPNAAQIIALQQILNEALEVWWEMIAEQSRNIAPIPWVMRAAPSVRWEANRMWGAWRQACIEGDWNTLKDLFEELDNRVTQMRGPGSWETDNWKEVQKQMLEYAQPAFRRHLESVTDLDRIRFNILFGHMVIAEDLISMPPKSFEDTVITLLKMEPRSMSELVQAVKNLYPSINFFDVGRLKRDIDNMRVTGRISYMDNSYEKLWAYEVQGSAYEK